LYLFCFDRSPSLARVHAYNDMDKLFEKEETLPDSNNLFKEQTYSYRHELGRGLDYGQSKKDIKTRKNSPIITPLLDRIIFKR
ncbi:MAG: hypothetical protein AAF335_04360, partial [Bacteroidota bacterium]